MFRLCSALIALVACSLGGSPTFAAGSASTAVTPPVSQQPAITLVASAGQTVTGTIPMSAQECAAFRQQHSELSSLPCVLHVGVHHDLHPSVPASQAPASVSLTAGGPYCQPGDTLYNGWCYASQQWWETDPSGYIWKHECSGSWAYNDYNVWQQYNQQCWTPYSWGWSINNNTGSPYVFNNGGAAPYYFLDDGDAFTVSAVWNGSPLTMGHWLDMRVWITGMLAFYAN